MKKYRIIEWEIHPDIDKTYKIQRKYFGFLWCDSMLGTFKSIEKAEAQIRIWNSIEHPQVVKEISI